MTTHTERAKCQVTVKEGPEGQVFLMIESGFLRSLGTNGMITLDLRAGTSIEEAKAIAKAFNASIESVAVTFDVKEIKQSNPF